MKKKLLPLLRDCTITALLLALSTLVGWFLQSQGLNNSSVIAVYLLAVLITARLTKGHIWGLTASVLSFVLFNWFFTEPFFSLKIYDPSNIIAVVIMTLTATITSTLTSKVKQAAAEAQEKEAASNALYQMTNHLTDAKDMVAIAEITVSAVSKILGCGAACVPFDESGQPMPSFVQQKADGVLVRRKLENPQQLKKKMEGLHAPVDVGPEFYDYPIYGQSSVLAVLRIPSAAAEALSDAQNRLIHSLIESAALAMERFRSLQAQAISREEATRERYRGNLLRAISHDLRTPLSGIMGTSEMMMGMTDPADPRYDMAKGVYQDADWLHSLVENILNLTRIQDGRLTLNKEPQAVEEVIGAALAMLEKRAPERRVEVTIPDSLLFVSMDARLITQVLLNLLDNAVKHTPEEGEISISVEEVPEEKAVRFAVCDRGSGIAPNDLPHVFQMFYTSGTGTVDSRPGVGLGLAICHSIVAAHGGSIQAANRPDGGAAFTFTLPMEDPDHESSQ